MDIIREDGWIIVGQAASLVVFYLLRGTGGARVLGAFSDQVMVDCEALSVWLVADTNGKCRVEVDPVNRQLLV
jgi:hypothetical protein